MNTYTANYAPQQPALRDEAAQMAPQSSYGQQLGAALGRQQPAGPTGMQNLASLMAMMQQFKGMQGAPGAQQTLAPVYDHSFPTVPGQ